MTLAYVSSAACYDVLTGPFSDFRGSAHTCLTAYELPTTLGRVATRNVLQCGYFAPTRKMMQGLQACECGTTVPEERRG